MAELIPGGPSVGRIFRAFHTLVADTVERLEAGPWAADAPPEIEPLREPILAAIRLVEQQLTEESAAEPAVVREVLYLLAVYADDRAMAASGPGGPVWASRRIEGELFGSALGAGEVGDRCERLLRLPTPENRQLARLFLYAFGLGLGGGPFAGSGRLAELRRRLLEFARPARQPAAGGRRRLFRQAYRYTAARGERRLLPDLRGWLALAAALLVLFILVSVFAWQGAVASVIDALGSPRQEASTPQAANEAGDVPPRTMTVPETAPPGAPAPPRSPDGPAAEPAEADA